MFPSVSWLSVAVLRRHLDVFRESFLVSAIPAFIDPLIWLVGMGYGLGALMRGALPEAAGFSYLEFIAPGVAAGAMMTAPAIECVVGSFVRLRFQKLYDAMLTTPCSLEDVVTGDILFGTVKAFVQAAAIFLVMAGLGLVKSWEVAFVPVFAVAAGFLFGSMGLCYCALIPEITWVDYFFALFITPMMLVSGAFFPLDRLPGWLQTAAEWTPLYHTVEPVRALTLGLGDGHLAYHLAWTLAAGVVFYFLALRLMRRRLIT